MRRVAEHLCIHDFSEMECFGLCYAFVKTSSLWKFCDSGSALACELSELQLKNATSEQVRLPAEFKHINKRRKRN